MSTPLETITAVFDMYGVNKTPIHMLEAEIARLERERDGYKRDFLAASERCADRDRDAFNYSQRLQAAEAEVARLKASQTKGTNMERTGKEWGPDHPSYDEMGQ